MNDSFSALEEQLKTERRKVDVSNIDFSTREIVRMYMDDELIISPSYQRKYRWSELIASKFIESIFLGLPIPPIFVATNNNFTWEVVDGLQRISTLILYMSDDLDVLAKVSPPSREPGPLKLQGLENLSQLNSTTYSDLPRPLQLYLARQPLQMISLTDKSNKSVRFDLFERLNTGSISLSAQEVRTAVYGSKFLSFIEALSENGDLKRLLKLQEAHQNDGTVTEQVLKFFAYKNRRNKFKGAVTKFLNSFTQEMSDDDSNFDYAAEQHIFEESMKFLVSLTGGPFLRGQTPVTPLVQFEAAAVGAGILIERKIQPIPPTGDWINDAELVSASGAGANTRAKLNRRIERAERLFSGEVDNATLS